MEKKIIDKFVKEINSATTRSEIYYYLHTYKVTRTSAVMYRDDMIEIYFGDDRHSFENYVLKHKQDIINYTEVSKLKKILDQAETKAQLSIFLAKCFGDESNFELTKVRNNKISLRILVKGVPYVLLYIENPNIEIEESCQISTSSKQEEKEEVREDTVKPEVCNSTLPSELKDLLMNKSTDDVVDYLYKNIGDTFKVLSKKDRDGANVISIYLLFNSDYLLTSIRLHNVYCEYYSPKYVEKARILKIKFNEKLIVEQNNREIREIKTFLQKPIDEVIQYNMRDYLTEDLRSTNDNKWCITFKNKKLVDKVNDYMSIYDEYLDYMKLISNEKSK